MSTRSTLSSFPFHHQAILCYQPQLHMAVDAKYHLRFVIKPTFLRIRKAGVNPCSLEYNAKCIGCVSFFYNGCDNGVQGLVCACQVCGRRRITRVDDQLHNVISQIAPHVPTMLCSGWNILKVRVSGRPPTRSCCYFLRVWQLQTVRVLDQHGCGRRARRSCGTASLDTFTGLSYVPYWVHADRCAWRERGRTWPLLCV